MLTFPDAFPDAQDYPHPNARPHHIARLCLGGGRKLEISPDSSEHRPALSDRHELPLNPPVTLCEQRTQGDSVSSCHFPTQKGALPSASPHVNRGRLGGSGSITKSVPRTPSVAPGTRNDLNFMPQRRCRRARAVRIAGNFELRRDPPF